MILSCLLRIAAISQPMALSSPSISVRYRTQKTMIRNLRTKKCSCLERDRREHHSERRTQRQINCLYLAHREVIEL
ncbi:hypothetical protein F5Y08DRAFT_315669 [Xylaria arbuscula]|nr:hypothetical protein F5Y08DRAFT_315669 [Xylaria arbuscula]